MIVRTVYPGFVEGSLSPSDILLNFPRSVLLFAIGSSSGRLENKIDFYQN
jgi:hypothetical protein